MNLKWNDWPGKSSQDVIGLEHPAAYHMLDVAAVSEQLIQSFCFAPPLRGALIILVGLHDLGKFSESFRAMLRDSQRGGEFRHWELSEILFYALDDVIGKKLGNKPRRRQMLYAAVAGHHGYPSQKNIGGLPLPDRLPVSVQAGMNAIGEGYEAAKALVEAFCDLWPEASLDSLSLKEATTLSWWLAGFCTASDWIASNTRWFEFCTDTMELSDYLSRIRPVAIRAVAEAGISGAKVSLGQLFNFPLRPMQRASADIVLPDGPTLVIMEDETGTGKTEAALLLAHRMLQSGKGRGLFFALPTMATTDAMFARARDVVGRIFQNPTVALAHGRASLSREYRDIAAGEKTGEAGDISCSDWLMESNRRALLADVGVGTIDQVLMAVLPVRYQTLRHYGLSSKILIVDEVHEFGDPFIAEELVALLTMHRAAGGSAILLTATLPLTLRSKLLETYGGQAESPAYPALTIAQGESVTQFPKDERPVKGDVVISRLETTDEAVELIVEKSRSGASCIWVRNAVDDAICAVNALKARGVEAKLLHARFALCDRKTLESGVLQRLGKHCDERRGYVLVATQIVESSLDLDADVMVSDIAPIAALIQRAGRLWRHMDIRPASTRPVSEPTLYVVSPDPDKVCHEKWLHEVLESGAWVYDIADVWRTAKTLFKRGKIAGAHEQRDLIEAVHGSIIEPVPMQLLEAESKALGKAYSQKALAHHNIADFASGYRAAGRGNDDVSYPTRLGDETRILCLARLEKDKLHPWSIGHGREAWALSEITVRASRLKALTLPDQDDPRVIDAKQDWPIWKRTQIILCCVQKDGAICEGLRYEVETGLRFVSRN